MYDFLYLLRQEKHVAESHYVVQESSFLLSYSEKNAEFS